MRNVSSVRNVRKRKTPSVHPPPKAKQAQQTRSYYVEAPQGWWVVIGPCGAFPAYCIMRGTRATAWSTLVRRLG